MSKWAEGFVMGLIWGVSISTIAVAFAIETWPR